MSRSDDEQQPGPTAGPAERAFEPRLLTRPVPSESPRKPRAPKPQEHDSQQHEVERGPQTWVVALRSKIRRERISQAGDVKGQTGHSPRRWRRPVWVAGGALGVVCLLLLGWVLVLRHAADASLPALDGEVSVPGLQAAVTVTRDAQGVPSLIAGNLQDLLFAQGYVTAGDRLWQMDALRRHGAGELAEVLGSSLVEHDRRQRILQMRAAADRAVDHLPPDQLAQLEAYARGVNRFIDTHRGSLPLEFRLLAYTPAPWTPRDSLLILLVMFQDLSTRFPQKLDRETLSAHLPAALVPDLYPVGSWRDVPPGEPNRNLSAPHPVELIPLDPSQAREALPHLPAPQARPEDLLAASEAFASADRSTDRCADCRAGSNNWAVSGERTASGKPLLANDMHLSLAIPDIWYEAGLHTRSSMVAGPIAMQGTAGQLDQPLDAVGFTLPGVPFVIVGRNARVAWGVTNLGADVQDVRVEHLRGTGADTEYQQPDGSWATVGHHSERIRVRGGADRTLDVLTTTHAAGAGTMETPIISPLYPSEARALSLAWTAYDPAALSVPFLAADSAVDGITLTGALAGFGGPTLNLVWADTGGHIGYHALGLIPVRGPAVRQPRATPPAQPNPVMPIGPPATDEGEGENGAAAVNQSKEGFPGPGGAPAPRLLLSAYRLSAYRLSAYRPGGRRRHTAFRSTHRGQPQPAAPAAPAAAQDVSAMVPTRNYTIGSPASSLPVDALDPSQAWSGYIAYADLPAVTDPAGGVLATANSRITPDDYPWSVTADWADPFRTERIVHVLNGRTGLTAADMLAIENDVYSDVNQATGQRIAYALDHAAVNSAVNPIANSAANSTAKATARDARRLHQAADLLRSWDGRMTVASPAAAVLAAVRDALWPALLTPQIAAHDAESGQTTGTGQAAALVQLYNWGERTTALELMLQHQPARWLPRNFATWNDFLADVTERGLTAAHAPADLRQWSYGRQHTVEIAHPVFGQHPWLAQLLGVAGSTGRQPAPGDFTTIKAIGAHFGPSERMIADLGQDLASPGAVRGNITAGESGNGRSPWYLDQFGAWLRGTTFALPAGGAGATHTLRLLPGGAS